MVLLGMLGYDWGLGAQDVAALPRFHHQWFPDVISAESGAFSPQVADALRKMGHTVDLPGDSASGGRGSSHVWGNLQTVEWDKITNTLHGGSDPRNNVGAAKVIESATP
jgi:gamma-glutamyltranspeptidase / glutathione hydrolase